MSGHSEHYKDNMFLTKLGDEEMGLKPMNCPSTFLVYRSRKWSFRDLPVRYAIFDPLYRNELSGVASGLFRVKILTQDDAHVIATEEQAEKELADILDLLAKMYGVFRLEYKVKISTRPDEPHGERRGVGEGHGDAHQGREGQGTAVRDQGEGGELLRPEDRCRHQGLARKGVAVRRPIQLDLQMPKRFRLAYTGPTGRTTPPWSSTGPSTVPWRGSSGY